MNNLKYSSKSQAENGMDNTTVMTPLRVKQSILANTPGGQGGTSNYNDLENKPKINGVELSGNKTAQELGISGNVQADWNTSDPDDGSYIKNKPTLATVATSGSYNDLTNTPTIPTVPTNVSAFTNDAGYLTQETDPIFSSSVAAGITFGDVANWNDKPQVSTMPTASSTLEGKVYQYVGATNASYTNGYFYKCVEESGVYSWQQLDVQPSGQAGDNGVPRYHLTCDASSANRLSSANKPIFLDILNYYLSHNNRLPFVFLLKSGNYYKPVENIYVNTSSSTYVSITFLIADNLHYARENQWGVRYLEYYNKASAVVYVTPSEWANGTITTVYYNSELNDTSSTTCTMNGLDPVGYILYDTNVLGMGNTYAYTPNTNYSPATKKYVDDLIPTVNDATLTIQKEGTTLGTFSANSSTNTSVNIEETDPLFAASAAADIESDDLDYWNAKQPRLESGVNIKTINDVSLLGSGNIIIGEGGVVATDVEINGTSITANNTADIQADGVYDPSTNKVALQSTVNTAKQEVLNQVAQIIDYISYENEAFTNPILGTTSTVGVVTVAKRNNPMQIKISDNVTSIRLNNNDTVYIGTDSNGKTRIFANNMKAIQSIGIGDFAWQVLSDGSVAFGGDE